MWAVLIGKNITLFRTKYIANWAKTAHGDKNVEIMKVRVTEIKRRGKTGS